MFCKYCGHELPDSSVTCTNCGKILNKTAVAAESLEDQSKQVAELLVKKGKEATSLLQTEGVAKYPLWGLGLAVAYVVLSVLQITLFEVAGTPGWCGVTAIVSLIMAMTGNRKLVPYMACLELVLSLYFTFRALVLGAIFALIALVLYVYVLFIGEKGKPCSWKYLILLPYLSSVVMAFIWYPFIAAIFVALAYLAYIGWRYLLIRWMYETQNMVD